MTPYWKREPWTRYFDGEPPGATPCKRHGFVDADGGLCPSCVSYVIGAFKHDADRAHNEAIEAAKARIAEVLPDILLRAERRAYTSAETAEDIAEELGTLKRTEPAP